MNRVFSPETPLQQLDYGRPRLTYDGPRAERDSRELFSALQHARSSPGDLLDLGCGPRDQAGPAKYLGYRYVGIDLFSDAADIRADAHALPFLPGSFDVVFSYAVLEHLHNPFLGLAEVRRVLRPNGIMVGTVSQGEPFHASFLHHTTWGLASVARFAGLSLERVWPSRDTLVALGSMGRYPLPVRWGLRMLATVDSRLPMLAPRRWLRWSPEEKLKDACDRAGSLCFVLRRREDEDSTGRAAAGGGDLAPGG
jgi:SAM-dependent methyltransferase